jgi:oxalate---CoA ligase
MTIPEIVARGHASAPAIVAENQPAMTYGSLGALIEKTVFSLNQLGIGRENRVAVVLPNGPNSATGFLTISAGAGFAPLNPAYSAPEFEFYLRDLHAAALVTPPNFCPAAIDAARKVGVPVIALLPTDSGIAGDFTLEGHRVKPPCAAPGLSGASDIALLLHSSGTTARPKLVPLTHRNLSTSALNIARTLALTPVDTCLNVMPLFHIHGLVGAVLSSISAGASVYCLSGFNGLRFFHGLQNSGATWYTAVPTMHQMILARSGERSKDTRLRFIRSSSAHLHTPIWRRLEDQFECPVLNSYGMTEASHQVTSNPLPPGVRKMGTVGTSSTTEYVILNESGEVQPQGIEGEVGLRGAAITQGYLSPAGASEAAFRNGWFRTGDSGVIDSDGYLSLTGRIKEIINCGGEKLSPAEIDEVLMDHPSVATALTFGASCPVLGERVCAVVVLRQGCEATESDLKSFAKERLAKFKVPRQVIIADEIPRGATGKMQRIGMARRLGLE